MLRLLTQQLFLLPQMHRHVYLIMKLQLLSVKFRARCCISVLLTPLRSHILTGRCSTSVIRSAFPLFGEIVLSFLRPELGWFGLSRRLQSVCLKWHCDWLGVYLWRLHRIMNFTNRFCSTMRHRAIIRHVLVKLTLFLVRYLIRNLLH